MALIYKVLFSSISTFETPPLFGRDDWVDGERSAGGGQMMRLRIAGICLLCTALSWGLGSLALAGAPATAPVQPYEGQIRSVKIDKCGLQPGSCEGSVILARAGGPGEVILAIRPGTWLKRGDQFVTIDELGVGNYVKVEAVQIPGQPLQQITVLSAAEE
jgi:hypothetical protein